jgi:inosine triphosphate pyrophosphatase
MPITFVTGNAKKFKEAQAFIPDLIQREIDLVEIQSLDSQLILKAKVAEALTQVDGPIIVEDVSLTIDNWNGLPGPLIKWFLESIRAEGIYNLTPDQLATARCYLAYAARPDDIQFFIGEVKGKIVAPRSDTQFGWDPIFQPEGSSKTYGQMTFQEKNQISHRSKAFLKLREYLHQN